MENKLKLLRQPFEKHQISKLPKPTKSQTDELQRDKSVGIRCDECGGWHHKGVIHLDYVGHAALTDRLLDVDENWNWEPMSANEDGSPKFDGNGGLWIKLTVCGVTRIGYGHPDGKTGGNAIKETIGDALRNAAMRFGAALDLWHKGDLHGDDEDKEFVIPAGKYKGMTFDEIDPKELAGYVEYTKESAKKTNKQITGDLKLIIEMYEKYLQV